jgi:hypothetical protein
LPNTASLFRLISEIIILLLGALLILVAITRGVALPARPSALVIVGLLLVYSGVRAGLRREPGDTPLSRNVRSGSLFLVGGIVIAMALLPLRYADTLLGLAGGVLALRGLAGGIIFARNPAANTRR